MMRPRAAPPLLVAFSCCLVPLLVLSSVWLPLLHHYYVPGATITDQMLEKSRRDPADSVLEEISGFRFFPRKWKSKERLIDSAEKLLRGEVSLPGTAATRIRLPFDPNDIDRGTESWQLNMAGLEVPDVLLEAYKATGRDEFFSAARDVILAWADYERHAWLPKGFLWNDHATAARAAVLGEFWQLYRHRSDFRLEVARAVLQFAARTGQMLAKPGQFTVTTNHGVMQNLALWHLCLAFPGIVDPENYKQLAFSRLNEQMTFYVNEEGVVLEHSAEYHALGVHLLGLAFRYMNLLNIAIPDDWTQKYEKARRFYVQLRRPDGSLPMSGDTHAVLGGEGPSPMPADEEVSARAPSQGDAPEPAASLYPVAGYAIWWNGGENTSRTLAQTVAAWSYFPKLGHKHADEMSVFFWGSGQLWWTNVGYWPYDDPNRKQAESWSGSNAPHLVNEKSSSARNTRLVSYAWQPGLAALELERKGPGEYVARRQLLQLKPNVWIVLDSFSGDSASRTTTTWTTAYDVDLQQGPSTRSFALRARTSGATLTAFVFGSPGLSVKEFKGRLVPFAGWEAVLGTPRPAQAIVTEQPARNAWAVTLWSLGNDSEPSTQWSEPPSMANWTEARDWKIALPLKSGTHYIRRDGEFVSFGPEGTGAKTETLKLEPALDVGSAKDRILRSHADAMRRHPKFRDLFNNRLRVTYLVLLILALQEIFFAAYRRMKGKRYGSLRILSVTGWLAMGLWLLAVYFKS